MELTERFISYCKIDTQSDPDTHRTPSTDKQYDLARLLVKELKEMGVEDACVNDKCIVYGHIKTNCDDRRKIGFVSHMDTSDQLTATGCSPRIINDYDGKDILLNEELGIVLSPEQFPKMRNDKGKTLIVTDGTTLLGGDDKAGIAAIMDLVQYIHEHPEFLHCSISIAFTPDEEIGEGADHFDLKEFDADYAYTVDGEDACDIEYENFNAAAARVHIKGLSIHPGSAKGKMVNASLVAMEFNALLPERERPEYTEGYEGFNHLTGISGEVDHCLLEYIIRNHDPKILERQKEDFRRAQEAINKKYGPDTVVLEISDSYRNMRELIEPHIEIVNEAKRIIGELGLRATSTAIRGGTDGAMLTYKGLPCPNLGTGTRNCHGRYEYVVVEEMKLVAELLKRLVAKKD
ncbi:MAG: peptidase T [Erysipelotrichaceae bacterium]|nr:peptidase T [Erysipelotrichaceae bacterium]